MMAEEVDRQAEDLAATTTLIQDLSASQELAFARARNEGSFGFAFMGGINRTLFTRALWKMYQGNYLAAINFLAMIWYREKNGIEGSEGVADRATLESAFLRSIGHEYDRAMNLFPGSEHNMNALTEEVGELAQALLQLQYEPKKGKTKEDVVKEAIQVAAVAMKIALQGDKTFPAFVGLAGQKAGA